MAAGAGGSLDAVGCTELAEDVGDVDARRLGADEQFGTDLAIRAAFVHESQDLEFPVGQPERGRLGWRWRPLGGVVGELETGSASEVVDLAVEGRGTECGGRPVSVGEETSGGGAVLAGPATAGSEDGVGVSVPGLRGEVRAADLVPA